MKVLSLFDGISCGMVALERSGINIEKYVAYEIDKYAVSVSQKNYPMIVQCGDVTTADFAKHKGFDLLIGGSPCTYWSVAKNNREITPDGIGGQLFMHYVRALDESGCKWFLYENNYSIHKNIKAFISKQLGVEPIMINSALLSAQQRKLWANQNCQDSYTYYAPEEVTAATKEDLAIFFKPERDRKNERARKRRLINAVDREKQRQRTKQDEIAQIIKKDCGE